MDHLQDVQLAVTARREELEARLKEFILEVCLAFGLASSSSLGASLCGLVGFTHLCCVAVDAFLVVLKLFVLVGRGFVEVKVEKL